MTVHFHSDRWIDIQLREIKRYTSGEYKIWGCLNGIGAESARAFDVVFDLGGEHPDKLNELARHVVKEADPDDLLVFIDGDAFPIADLVPRISELLGDYPLVAVRRSENLGDPQPHPCFAVTTAKFWTSIDGDWTRHGPSWINEAGVERQDAGGRILATLDEKQLRWYPLLRSNAVDLHPVLFAVYDDLVYHHGAAFREARTTVDRYRAGMLRWRSGPMRQFAKLRLWLRERRNLRVSAEIYDQIRRDADYVKRTFVRPRGEIAST